MTYSDFLANKPKTLKDCGFSLADGNMNPLLFDWQREVTRWAIRKGRAALFEGCGMGKTVQELEWAHQVSCHTHGNILILAPLAVAEQTHGVEAPRFSYSTTRCYSQPDVRDGINITNYDMLQHFDVGKFAGVVLDESSILKSFTGATTSALIESCKGVPYRLCGTATPAPNDYVELGNHAEFLGVMSRVEMLSMFFVHDGGDTGQWRLKGHAEKEFWKWVCSWAVVIRKPSDIGYSDEGYSLPPIHRIQITIPADTPNEGYLIPMEAKTLRERQSARRVTVTARAKACADVVNASSEQWIIWCGLDKESAELAAAIPDAVEVKGPQKREFKTQAIRDFQSGKIRVIISKITIYGYGMNLQNCRNWFHVGLSDSFEQRFQGDRRCWRFGQEMECFCYIVTSELEGAVVRNTDRKERDFEAMNEGMVEHMREEMNREVRGATMTSNKFENEVKKGTDWEMRLGDCVEELAKIPDGSIHYSVFSPPFASLYTYSASDRDMGNASDMAEFMKHFNFAVKELARVIMAGRLVSFHCMNMPSSKERDGYIGIKDFRGDLIRLFENYGFIFHSEVVIWKDPLVAASRTHALGLAHKQIVKDAAMCRQGIPDYLVTMRKPGDNPEPVEHKPRGFERYIGQDAEPKRERSATARENKYSHEVWQRYASPVWMDINPSDTLQRESAREEKDERHICPLQLQVIRRAVELWTNPGDTVLSPFAGIGSEGYVALQEGRKFIGIELKRSYWQQGWMNLERAVKSTQFGLFAGLDEPHEDAGIIETMEEYSAAAVAHDLEVFDEEDVIR